MLGPRESEPVRFGVVFRIGTSGATAGELTVNERSFALVGGSVDEPIELSVAYSGLDEVRIGRSTEERLNGRPALQLVRRDGPLVQLVPLGFGLLYELADLLTALAIQQEEGNEQVVVVIPLKTGCLERAKELVAQGPPFDPATLSLKRHQIFVTGHSALFVFVGPNVREKLRQATRNPSFWRAGLAWRACIAGRPHVTNPGEALPADRGRPLYSWAADDKPS